MESEETKVEGKKTRIDSLEERKAKLIGYVRYLNRKIRYTQYEYKALLPFLEKTKDVQVAPHRRKKRALEYKISTVAYTPRIEREFIKQLKKVDEELAEVKDVEDARRKKKFLEEEMEGRTEERTKLEQELNKVRDELRKLYDENKVERAVAKRAAAAQARAEEDMVALGDLALIEKK